MELDQRFLKPKPLLLRYDILPFLASQLFLIWTYWKQYFGLIYFSIAISLLLSQLLLYLFTHWSNYIRGLVAFSSTTLEDSTHILIQSKKHKHKHRLWQIVPLNRNPLSFEYFHKKYVFDDSIGQFNKVPYPIGLTFQEYKESKSLSEELLNKAETKWGGNKMELPIPTFSDLMLEHILAPFFVFQLFCVLLWMLDEYWQLSFYTLVMLVVFESTVVMQRIANWKRIKAMRRPPQPILALRNKGWREISSDLLYPGDIVSITKKDQRLVLPCDMLLLDGSCSVDESILTGESVPQMKDDISQRHPQDCLSLKQDKTHLLMGGTEILDVKLGKDSQGMRCYVLRTSWDTTQGKLMRTILYSSDRLTVGSKEAFFFISILLVFALMATGYVVYYTMDDPKRDPYKLLLKCILIITSVVPPELPIELALAVNSSILSLQTKQIFCTEPFRLPLAGKASICCFDKTGTLTDQDFEVKGISISSGNLSESKSLRQLDSSREASLVIAGCNTLSFVNGDFIGDPVEKAAFKAIGAQLTENGINFKGLPITILKRFGFTSDLKRMSTVIRLSGNGPVKPLLLVTKGAPEVLQNLFQEVPVFYKNLLEHFASQGLRILALGIRELTNEEAMKLSDIGRDELENKLQYCGLLVLKSPIKPDTAAVIEEILASGHKSVIITGDNIFTAGEVALTLNYGQELRFIEIKSNEIAVVDNLGNPGEVSEKSVLCVNGDALPMIIGSDIFYKVKVFARVSPAQKEQIVNEFNRKHVTIMCGDGTNDVGGLKKAHAGIALLNKPVAVTKPNTPSLTSEMLELGDASMAAHFTSKKSTILAVKHLIQQGRCTLVTTYQMYKILALNCLMSAFSLSVLYLDGIKYGDTQATIGAICISVFFFFVSRSTPMDKLSHHHPPSTVFEPHIIISVFGQFAVQLIGLLYVNYITKPFVLKDDDFNPDSDFKPNILSSAIFLYTSWINAANFLVNYQGEPFMKKLQENAGLFKSLKVYFVVILAAALQVDPLPEILELFPFPSIEYSFQLAGVLVVNLGLCLGIEKTCNYFRYRD
ncbi:ATP13A1 [Blepharisma stoltei]|uniref:P-type ATPase A domain-containing protein n=1 Tax=Blepharisma stoltei TaxID=1481888 RepID=A0AAU9JF95_9CILI|nr:unnamed protein product [Blepharisma stoltei]